MIAMAVNLRLKKSQRYREIFRNNSKKTKMSMTLLKLIGMIKLNKMMKKRTSWLKTLTPTSGPEKITRKRSILKKSKTIRMRMKSVTMSQVSKWIQLMTCNRV